MTRSETVLITGCSAGIGQATVEWAAARGHTVIATAINEIELQAVPDSAKLRLVLDITDPNSIETAMDEIRNQVGPVSVLVNNAGICQPGPIELLTDEQIRRQLDVNLEGHIRMIRAVLPDMRTARRGTIVNVTSMLGRMSVPFSGIYNASKYAMEAISDALRVEVSQFGVRVVIIEPGWIRSRLVESAKVLSDDQWYQHGPYAETLSHLDATHESMRYGEGTPEDVARTIIRAVESKRPRARYPVTWLAHVMPILLRILPTSVGDRLVARAIRP